MPLSDREGGFCVRICESGDLPAGEAGRSPGHESLVATNEKEDHHCVLLPRIAARLRTRREGFCTESVCTVSVKAPAQRSAAVFFDEIL